MYTRQFIKALEDKDIKKLRKIPKSDLHNHAILGGNLDYIEKWLGRKIPRLTKRITSIEEMEDWVSKNYLPYVQGTSGFEKAIEAAFVQAKMDGVIKLEMSIDVYFRHFYNGSAKQLIKTLKKLHQKYAPEVNFIPELGFNRSVSEDLLIEWFEPYLDFDYFKSVDLYGDELAQPAKNFKRLYQMAKSKGLKLKAHVGEFGNADSIQETVEILELNEVQHGITAVKSKSVMSFLQKNNIQLNICPTSNYMLNRVDSIKKHPIRKLFDSGIKVTVNTDDVIVFQNGVSEEFLLLYEHGVFSAEELNIIRMNGLI
ncbi:amidohydrolase family protein [Thermosipho atlanticus]|uniref:Adenosine deaminase n=1 Tax=Thermosipho atlanticus DSM 15807 TaxID=1123380 RepID=A0A1M5R5L3_9BACT|nr:adenosine deaminase [Thermosipho atlanticus]SHH21674.1 adenosine deaminase [Thermosipho atlanticus DSM 15807]